MTAAWARRAAAVSPPPASLLSGSRVSSRARLCRPLVPGSCFLLRLPAALTAPCLGAASSSMEAGSGTACPETAQVMGAGRCCVAGPRPRAAGKGVPRSWLLLWCCPDLRSQQTQNLGLDAAIGAVPVVNRICWELNSFQSHPGVVPSVSQPLTGLRGDPAPMACLQPPCGAQLPCLLGRAPTPARRAEQTLAGVEPACAGGLPAREGSQLSHNVPEPMHLAQP